MKSPVRTCAFLVTLALTLPSPGCVPKTAAKMATPAAVAGAMDHLHADLERIFTDANFANAQWGVEVVSLDRGDVLYEHNSTRLYMPASNNKLLTTVSALIRLGPDYRYETTISADGTVADGILRGNLVITGSGDPTIAARFHDGDPFSVFKDWASKLKEKGIRKIEGGILADGRAFPPPLLGQNWEWDDLIYGYAAPVSALQFNENLYTIEVIPGDAEGAPAIVRCSPLPDYVAIDANVTTLAAGTKGKLDYQRGERRESIIIRGTIAKADRDVTTLAVELPAIYYIAALKKTLQEAGIDVANTTLRAVGEADATFPATEAPLYSHWSPPLSEIVKPMLKVSQNLYAETLARTLGLVLKKQGRFEAGKEVVEETLGSMAIQKGTYAYVDGSGLSRQNLVSADMLVRIFKYMFRSKYFATFFDALPIAGVDGTIRGRMKGTKAENNVHGKTGTIAYVRCLSGYVRTGDDEMLAFAMIANNFLATNPAVEYVQDSALVRLANFRRQE